VANGVGCRSPQQEQREWKMTEGTVTWFNDSKGYGFISQEGGQDVFVHYSVIESDGFRSLAEGDKVQFELSDGEKGPQVSKVRKI
jgi:CspA family cold shock protein